MHAAGMVVRQKSVLAFDMQRDAMGNEHVESKMRVGCVSHIHPYGRRRCRRQDRATGKTLAAGTIFLKSKLLPV